MRFVWRLTEVDVVRTDSINRATISDWSSMDVVVRSRWMGFLPIFSSGTGRNSIRNLVSSVGTSSISSWVSPWISQRSVSAQNPAQD